MPAHAGHPLTLFLRHAPALFFRYPFYSQLFPLHALVTRDASHVSTTFLISPNFTFASATLH
jgi:hypothetical protein